LAQEKNKLLTSQIHKPNKNQGREMGREVISPMKTQRFMRRGPSLALLLCLAPLTAAAGAGSEKSQSSAQESVWYECRERPRNLAEPPKTLPPGAKDRRGKQVSAEPARGVEAKPVCPGGQLPYPRAWKAPKGNPLFSGTAVDAPYNYADAFATAGGKGIPLFDGGGVVTIVEDPAISAVGGTHSLFEIAVQGGAGNGNIVEIGWIVQPGDTAARLFVFHWIGWNPTCYNGCGWVQWNPGITPGMYLATGSETYMGWVFFGGNWWGWYEDQWVGYFPGGEWNGQYTKSSLVQWFGEVYDSDPTPATDMGTGYRANDARAARFWFPCEVDAAAWVCWINPNPSLNQPSAPWYTIAGIGGFAFRYGGPGGRPGIGIDP
jgi:hypothetical protein